MNRRIRTRTYGGVGGRERQLSLRPDNSPPVTEKPIPIFSVCEGYPNVIFIRGYIDLALDEGYYELSQLETDMMLDPGEATFTNNCVLLHKRTAFEDGNTEETRRHLLRLWLANPERPSTREVQAHKTDRGITKLEGRGTYYKGRGPGY